MSHCEIPSALDARLHLPGPPTLHAVPGSAHEQMTLHMCTGTVVAAEVARTQLLP